MLYTNSLFLHTGITLFGIEYLVGIKQLFFFLFLFFLSLINSTLYLGPTISAVHSCFVFWTELKIWRRFEALVLNG